MDSRQIAAFAAGLLFGAGLYVSGMTDPANIVAFLDVGGDWSPRLALVMAGALIVTFAGYRLAFARRRPLFESEFSLPAASAIDGRLIAGSALFGVGWGLSGYCPGPGLAALTIGGLAPAVFLAAMFAGMAAFRLMPAPKAA